MKIHRYEGRDYKEALGKVKADLGVDAVILHTKTFMRRGFWRLWGKQMVEITAAEDLNILESPRRKRETQVLERPAAETGSANTREETKFVGRVRKAYGVGGDAQQRVEQVKDTMESELASAPNTPLRGGSLQQEMSEIKTLLNGLLKDNRSKGLSGVPEMLRDMYLYLMENEIAEDLARELILKLNENLSGDALRNREIIREKLKIYIEEMIQVSQPPEIDTSRARTIALVGPTGVGKTTTIAKLAANFSLRRGLKVGLITQDTYRLAAVEQLRTFAKILGLQVEVVNTPAQMREAVKYLQSKDVILIDTAGRSQNNEMHMNELTGFMEAAQPDEVHLVLSLSASFKTIQQVVERFEMFKPTQVILTKLDESAALGLALNVIAKVNKKLSYVTFGQEVPDDIEAGQPRKLAELILGERALDYGPSFKAAPAR